jgi:hypothetical protein
MAQRAVFGLCWLFHAIAVRTEKPTMKGAPYTVIFQSAVTKVGTSMGTVSL